MSDLQPLTIRGREFLVDLPPCVAQRLEVDLLRVCCRALDAQPWTMVRFEKFMVLLPPIDRILMLPGADENDSVITTQVVTFTVHPPEDGEVHQWLVEPDESQRPLIAAYARGLLSQQLVDVEEWVKC